MAALAYVASGESRGICQPQHIVSGMIRGNPDTEIYFRKWEEIAKITPYSPYLGQHLNSISRKSELQPLLIIGGREGVGLVLNVDVQSTNLGSEIAWNVSQSEGKALMAQGRAYWFATFSANCKIRVSEVRYP